MTCLSSAVDKDVSEQERVERLARELALSLIETTDRLLKSTCCEEDYLPTLRLFLEATSAEAQRRAAEVVS